MKFDARRIECMAFHPLGSARVGLDPRGGVVDQRGETFDVGGLFVADGSVLLSIGVNSQVPIPCRWRRASRRASTSGSGAWPAAGAGRHHAAGEGASNRDRCAAVGRAAARTARRREETVGHPLRAAAPRHLKVRGANKQYVDSWTPASSTAESRITPCRRASSGARSRDRSRTARARRRPARPSIS
ncbi:MAG: GMC oxidoreductase [Polyangiaceae bacterium]